MGARGECRTIFAAPDKGTSEWPNHPCLQGNFAPVQEEVAADNLKVIGTLPSEMDGMLVRNGPNPQFPPLGNYHWFFGDGMLHGVRVQGGKASYRNRYVRTVRWQEEHAAGKALYDTFQAPPEKRNRGNTALVWHAGRLLALYEGGPPHRITVPELDTLGLSIAPAPPTSPAAMAWCQLAFTCTPRRRYGAPI